MTSKKRLQKKQHAVLDDLFGGELEEQTILEKHKVKKAVYNRWHGNESFAAEFTMRIEALNRQSELIIAKYRALAAAKLVQLTESEKEETARKACLDIISLPRLSGEKAEQAPVVQKDAEKQTLQLSPETANKLLAVLAETENSQANSLHPAEVAI